MAHVLKRLVQGLCLHSSRRQQERNETAAFEYFYCLDVDRHLAWGGYQFPFVGYVVCSFLILEKLFLGKILQKIPGFFGWLYTMFLVLLSWSFFSIEDGAVLANVWRSLFFRAPGGVFNREALYFWENYRLLFFLLAVCSLPVGKMRRKKYGGASSARNAYNR